MKKFMAVFTAHAGAFEKYMKQFPNEEQRKANDRKGIDAWKKWVDQHAKSIVEGGGPLGKTKRVTRTGIADARNDLVGFTVVQAESAEAAAKMFLDHPNFTVFGGEGVDIMECLPIPQNH